MPFSAATRAVCARTRQSELISSFRRVTPRVRSVFMFNLPTILDSQRFAPAIGQRRATMRADALVRSVQSLVATTERSGDVGGSWRVRIGLQRPAMKGGNVDQTDCRDQDDRP